VNDVARDPYPLLVSVGIISAVVALVVLGYVAWVVYVNHISRVTYVFRPNGFFHGTLERYEYGRLVATAWCEQSGLDWYLKVPGETKKVKVTDWRALYVIKRAEANRSVEAAREAAAEKKKLEEQVWQPVEQRADLPKATAKEKRS
jgi:hypothetical protein